jgi:cell division protein FtsL
MYGITKRNNEVQRNKQALPKTVFSARRRGRQRRPFFFHMGSVALSITSVLLIGLMAVLYLSQVGQAAVANQQLQEIRSEQATLRRENQDLSQTIAIERSPAYITTQAAKAGLVPEDPKDVKVIQVPGLQPLPEPGK